MKKKFIYSKVAFSLVEVMIALGATSALSLAVMQIHKMMNDTSKNLNQNYEGSQKVFEIIQAIRDKKSCEATLNNIQLPPSGSRSVSKIIRVSKGGLQTDVAIPGTTYGYGNGRLKLQALTIMRKTGGTFESFQETPVQTDVGTATLRIAFLKVISDGGGSSSSGGSSSGAMLIYDRDIQVVIKRNLPYEITTCFSSEDDSYIETTCSALGGRVNLDGSCQSLRVAAFGSPAFPGTPTPGSPALTLSGDIYTRNSALRMQQSTDVDVWIQGPALTTPGGSSRHLALRGDASTSTGKLYVNYQSEYDGGTVVGLPLDLARTTSTKFSMNSDGAITTATTILNKLRINTSTSPVDVLIQGGAFGAADENIALRGDTVDNSLWLNYLSTYTAGTKIGLPVNFTNAAGANIVTISTSGTITANGIPYPAAPTSPCTSDGTYLKALQWNGTVLTCATIFTAPNDCPDGYIVGGLKIVSDNKLEAKCCKPCALSIEYHKDQYLNNANCKKAIVWKTNGTATESCACSDSATEEEFRTDTWWVQPDCVYSNVDPITHPADCLDTNGYPFGAPDGKECCLTGVGVPNSTAKTCDGKLLYGTHSYLNCTTAGGTPTVISSNRYCVFPTNTECPIGFTLALTQTMAVGGAGGDCDTGCDNGAHGSGCNGKMGNCRTGGHGWSLTNHARETCGHCDNNYWSCTWHGGDGCNGNTGQNTKTANFQRACY